MSTQDPSGAIQDAVADARRVDRRTFLRHTGTAALAGGALWTAPRIVGAPPVFAAGTTTAAWTLVETNSAPGGRYYHATATDASDNIVLFGGRSGGSDSFVNDTWIWDGTTWTRQHPTTSPGARYGHAMATDASGNVVLYGGYGRADEQQHSGYLDDTWIWDGTTWTRQHPVSSPGARDRHAMATGADGNVVLYSGFVSGDPGEPGYLDDIWIWDGTTWTRRHPTTTPGPRFRHAMATDADGNTVLFGGTNRNSSSRVDDTWTWNGATWNERHPTIRPAFRYDHAMATDPNGNVLLYGGWDGTNLGDTWIWNGATWIEQFSASSPAARNGHAMATHRTGATVLFGGWNGAYLSDTWVWS